MAINEKEFVKRLERGDFGVIFPKSRNEADAERLARMTDYAVGIVQYDDNSFGVIIDKRKIITERRADSCEELDEFSKEDPINESGVPM